VSCNAFLRCRVVPVTTGDGVAPWVQPGHGRSCFRHGRPSRCLFHSSAGTPFNGGGVAAANNLRDRVSVLGRALGTRSELNHAPRPPCPVPTVPLISSVLAQLGASAGGTDAPFLGTDDHCDAFLITRGYRSQRGTGSRPSVQPGHGRSLLGTSLHDLRVPVQPGKGSRSLLSPGRTTDPDCTALPRSNLHELK